MWIVPLLVAAALLVYVRTLLPFRLPVPWPDETSFVAPAFAFSQRLSFFDPGLDPDRVIMWMPPGYTLLLAAVFRLFGYSFGAARWVSTIAALMCLVMVGRLGWRVTSGNRRLLASVTAMLAFVSPNMLISANVARMEQVFACLIILAMTAAVASRLYVAGAIVVSAAVVHFNAVYFIAPIVLQFGVMVQRRQLKMPARSDWLMALAAAAVLSAYIIYAALNWHSFIYDMDVQFRFRFQGNREPARFLWHLAAAASMAAVVAWRTRFAGAPIVVAAFGCAFVAMTDNGSECWYDYGQPLGFALLTVALLALATDKIARPAAYVAMALTAIAAGELGNETPLVLPRLPPFRRELVPAAEMAKVHAFIATLHAGSSVNFGVPGMEPFFLKDLAHVGAHWVIPAHSVTKLLPLRTWQWSVRCDSSDFSPRELQGDPSHARVGVDDGCKIFQDKP